MGYIDCNGRNSEMNYEKIDHLVESMRDELIADMKRWIAVPSVQGPAQVL